MLGDSIEKVTKAAGVKTCGGCSERKENLNYAHTLVRRAFINRGFWGGLGLTVLLGKNELVKAAWRSVGAAPELQLGDVLGFIRTMNTQQPAALFQNGKHLDREELLSAVASHREHFGKLTWMGQFTPGGEQPLPGWDLDTDIHDKSYVMILKSKEYAFITDETGIIYRAPVSDVKAHDIRIGSAYPGAVATGELPLLGSVPEHNSLWARVKAWFTPTTVYALNCCTSSGNCHACGACTCVFTCCNHYLGSNYPPNSPSCYFNIGAGFCTYYGFYATWYDAPCGNMVCIDCAKLFSTCCQKIDCNQSCYNL